MGAELQLGSSTPCYARPAGNGLRSREVSHEEGYTARSGAFASLLLLLPPPLAAAELPAAAFGFWEGAINLPGMELKIRLELSRDDKGAPVAKVDIPQQGALGLSTTDLVAGADGNISFQLAGVPGDPTFSGALGADGQWSGRFTQRGQSFPFSLSRGEKKALLRPQTPQPPFPYSAIEVDFLSSGNRLAGTLTVPSGDGPFPAILLFAGSGPQDRDSTVFGHKPFWVLADRLSRNGFAVLRLDDRGQGSSQGDFAAATTVDFVADARAALKFLAGRPEIDGTRLGICGHSEGALVGAAVAAHGEVSFAILLAGPAVPGKDLIPEQAMRLAAAGGAGPLQAAAAGAQLKTMHQIVLGEPDNVKALERLVEFGLSQLQATGAAAATEAEVAQIRQQMSQLLTPWFRNFLAFDPAPDFEKIKVPVLFLYGEKDLQVPPAQNRPIAEAAVAKSGNTRAEFLTLPGLNHLLQPSKTGHISEYAEIETTMAEEALGAILDFARKSMASPASAQAGGPSIKP